MRLPGPKREALPGRKPGPSPASTTSAPLAVFVTAQNAEDNAKTLYDACKAPANGRPQSSISMRPIRR